MSASPSSSESPVLPITPPPITPVLSHLREESLSPPFEPVIGNDAEAQDTSYFRPRKEFIPSIATPHDFALLTLCEANVVRLVGFPEDTVRALKAVLAGDGGRGEGIKWERRGGEKEKTKGKRETVVEARQSFVEGEMVEWWLVSKPWKEKKQTTEVLLTLIFTTLISQSFHFVSPLYLPSPSVHLSAIFSRSIEPQLKRRAAFGISFPAVFYIRVIGAPLSETPGILPVVRNGWASRLKEERNLGAGGWEFKLKGTGFMGAPPEPPGPEVVLDTLSSFNRQGIDLITIVRINGTEVWLFECPAGPVESVGNHGNALPTRMVTQSNA